MRVLLSKTGKNNKLLVIINTRLLQKVGPDSIKKKTTA